jgi:hypothetical protein
MLFVLGSAVCFHERREAGNFQGKVNPHVRHVSSASLIRVPRAAFYIQVKCMRLLDEFSFAQQCRGNSNFHVVFLCGLAFIFCRPVTVLIEQHERKDFEG